MAPWAAWMLDNEGMRFKKKKVIKFSNMCASNIVACLWRLDVDMTCEHFFGQKPMQALYTALAGSTKSPMQALWKGMVGLNTWSQWGLYVWSSWHAIKVLAFAGCYALSPCRLYKCLCRLEEPMQAFVFTIALCRHVEVGFQLCCATGSWQPLQASI